MPSWSTARRRWLAESIVQTSPGLTAHCSCARTAPSTSTRSRAAGQRQGGGRHLEVTPGRRDSLINRNWRWRRSQHAGDRLAGGWGACVKRRVGTTWLRSVTFSAPPHRGGVTTPRRGWTWRCGPCWPGSRTAACTCGAGTATLAGRLSARRRRRTGRWRWATACACAGQRRPAGARLDRARQRRFLLRRVVRYGGSSWFNLVCPPWCWPVPACASVSRWMRRASPHWPGAAGRGRRNCGATNRARDGQHRSAPAVRAWRGRPARVGRGTRCRAQRHRRTAWPRRWRPGWSAATGAPAAR